MRKIKRTKGKKKTNQRKEDESKEEKDESEKEEGVTKEDSESVTCEGSSHGMMSALEHQSVKRLSPKDGSFSLAS